MNISEVKVDWSYLNPRLNLKVDALPNLNDLRYEFREGIFYAERDGFVDYFAMGTAEDGHEKRVVTLKDGGTVTVHGGNFPGRASMVNALGLGPCVDVEFMLPTGIRVGAITVDLARLLAGDMKLRLVEIQNNFRIVR